jgi:hypothetical protein
MFTCSGIASAAFWFWRHFELELLGSQVIQEYGLIKRKQERGKVSHRYDGDCKWFWSSA